MEEVRRELNNKFRIEKLEDQLASLEVTVAIISRGLIEKRIIRPFPELYIFLKKLEGKVNEI